MSFSPYDGLQCSIRRGSRFPPPEESAMQQKITPTLWFDTEAE